MTFKPRKDISGTKHGRLLILGPGSAKKMWRVRCDCGVEKEIMRDNLKRTHSCGCFRDDKNRATMAANPDKFIGSQLRHGHNPQGKPSPTYHSWHSMWQRCTNPERDNYPYYGGRGISVCDRWKSFDAFLEDMGERPDGLTIGRIDNEGNYEPGNCQWETRIQQANNRRVRVDSIAK